MSDGLPSNPARAYAVAVTDGTPPGAYQTGFRDYGAAASGVRELYRLQHRQQTVALVEAKRREFLGLERRRMTVREAIELLDQLVDESDPDTRLSQLDHLLQTAEAIRAGGHPRWFVLTGLLHDLGKVLCLFGEPQWAVVGDTFPVGCRFAEEVVHHELFADNPDLLVPEYQTPAGIYADGIGLDHVLMSWGHDEYLYHVLKDRLPEPALYAIRYHSFYAAHRDGAYGHLMNDRDREMFAWVRAFSGYDLYSKADGPPDARALWPYYDALIAEFVPGALAW
jgi:inositol oxygenase